MEHKQSIKEIVAGIYHMILDGSSDCPTHGKILADFIRQNQLPTNSILILDGSSNNCEPTCNKDFLDSLSRFHAIAYILGEKTIEQTNWQHAHLISSCNIGTRYFNTDNDAYNWSNAQIKALQS
ncbi:MAG: hypothetical protein GQ548_00820 [Methylophaga sp.]|nr:hypothetical protein [Methylophaga sp.]